ncbi:hypothetical protein QBO83_004204 [Pseudomonas aeruginosa]|nr:hypothetical protein [Pseudomonas aeruginosa]
MEAIRPKRSAAFSPNLRKWLLAYGRPGDAVYRLRPGQRPGQHSSRYGGGEGALFIGQPFNGYAGDQDFSGILLMSVLCNGPGAKRCCLPGAMRDLEVVEDFWLRYREVGRCAIDPEHQVLFRDGGRYRHVGDEAVCCWCDAVVIGRSAPAA